jgi:hypothetical protein
MDVAEEILGTFQMIDRNSEGDCEKRILEHAATFLQGQRLVI